MSEIATGICWGVVVVTWIAGATYWARGRRAKRQAGPTSELLWRLGSLVAAALVYRFARHDLHGVTDHSWWIELPGLVC